MLFSEYNRDNCKQDLFSIMSFDHCRYLKVTSQSNQYRLRTVYTHFSWATAIAIYEAETQWYDGMEISIYLDNTGTEISKEILKSWCKAWNLPNFCQCMHLFFLVTFVGLSTITIEYKLIMILLYQVIQYIFAYPFTRIGAEYS